MHLGEYNRHRHHNHVARCGDFINSTVVPSPHHHAFWGVGVDVNVDADVDEAA